MTEQKNEKIYHIYVKNKCLYHSLSEEDFHNTWNMVNNFIDIYSEFNKNDITYEELTLNKELIFESSH
jgi:hypothetical protein